MKTILRLSLVLFVMSFICAPADAQTTDVQKSLKGFDSFIGKLMKEWNAPGVSVGIVVKDKLVFAKGYGYRDLENKQPVTSSTLFPIASNTKLFTAVGAGFLVEEGKLAWDKPVSEFDPSIRFYNDELNRSVTLRDMLSHRTGISRHDFIWVRSDFTRRELFERIKYLEPSQPLRQGYLYNNLMYMGVGQVMENLTGKTWESILQERVLQPLRMNSTYFTIEDMEKRADFAFSYYEQKDTTLLVKRPLYRQMHGVGPCGSIVSNVQDMSKWVIALMNKGRVGGSQVIPEAILSATLQPAMALSNTALETKGYREVLNPVYGMGRSISSYKGHYSTQHSGAIGGFYSMVSTLLYDGIGVIVFVNGSHNYPMVEIITRNIYDRMLGVEQTPWHERAFADYVAGKKADIESSKKEGSDKIAGTSPSHSLREYAGEFEHPAYGIVKIDISENHLRFNFHGIDLPLEHFHYDRFDSKQEPLVGKWSVNFSTNPLGEIDKVLMALDESEVTFTRKPDQRLYDPAQLQKYVGKYITPAGNAVEVKNPDGKTLYIIFSGQPQYELVPSRGGKFRFKAFSDTSVEFVAEANGVSGFKLTDPSGELFHKRI